ncbi:unnamed protein product [Hymenolepis diminuta]|uniref:Uncharacterized protein n=1 Tax=Hymenolepis diminuta TaxID=6216 RepID=A0A564XWN4_HYMDI|nr:unnamed protein product [Hymenolepis diminuta]VUZ39451.1 unnamed protein product [Hymenolepis diminuta]
MPAIIDWVAIRQLQSSQMAWEHVISQVIGQVIVPSCKARTRLKRSCLQLHPSSKTYE